MRAGACAVCDSTASRRLFTKEGHEFVQCRSCGLIRIDPQPTSAVLAGIYGSHYYEAWGVQTDADRVWQLKKGTFRKHVLGAVNLKAGARVLDCGAAYGALMEAAKELGLEPYGIELAAEAAAAVARRFGPGRIFSGPFERAVFAEVGEESFDAVFMCDFIEHVRDPHAVLRKAMSLLRPSGSLVITTPDGGSVSCRLMGASWPHYKIEHLYYFSQANLTSLLERAGATVRYCGWSWKMLDLGNYSGARPPWAGT